MSIAGFNLNRALAPTSIASLTHQTQNLDANSQSSAASIETLVTTTFASHQPVTPPSLPMTPMASRFNPLLSPNTNSYILDFLDIKTLASILRLVCTQIKNATQKTLEIRLLEIKELSYEEILNYEQVLNLENPEEVLTLCRKNGKSNLQHLNLSRIHYYINNYENQCMQLAKLISSHHSHLKSLDLSYCKLSDHQMTTLFASNLTSLTSLVLIECRKLTDAVLQSIAVSSPHLTSLQIDDCKSLTENAIRNIPEQFPYLTSLSVAGWNLVRWETFSSATRKALAPYATSLNLSSFRGTEERLRNIVAEFPNLTHLNLSQSMLTNVELKALASCSHLISLNLLGCRWLTEEGLGIITSQSPDLAEIKLPYAYLSSKKLAPR